MARKRGNPGAGRPSKGERRLIASRVPEQVADAIYNAADEQGITISEYVADLLSVAHGYPPTSKPAHKNQEALPISA